MFYRLLERKAGLHSNVASWQELTEQQHTQLGQVQQSVTASLGSQAI